MSYPSISIIIPCRNEEKYIDSLLASLIAQDYTQGNIEILFIDGMSTDNTRDMIGGYARNYPFLKLIDNPRKIVPVAMNIGIQRSRGDIIIRMDAHAMYPTDYVSKCVEYLGKTGADNVGGPITSISDTFWGRAIAAGMSSVFGVGNSRFRIGGFEGYVDTVPFGAYRRDVFDRVGLFDEELVRNQDDELNYRLLKSGGKIYMASGITSHYYPRDSLTKLWRQYYEYGYWKVRVIQKHTLPASWRHLVPVSFVLSILVTGLLSLIESRFLYLLSTIAGSYLLLSVFFSAGIAREKGMRYLPAMPAVYAVLHVSYGVGFLHGIWDFVLAGKRGGVAAQKKKPDAGTISPGEEDDISSR